MNVTVENLAACKKLLRVEVDAQSVDAEYDKMLQNYQRHAALPGFRPGKAPRDMVARRYEKDILDELKKKLLGDSYRQAVKDQKLNVVGYPDVEEIQFARGQALQFAATIETAPEFTLPDYKGLPAKRETAAVTDEDVERAVNMLREQQAKFEKVDRAAQAGDVAVLNYTGTVEGKSIAELAPDQKSLGEKKASWMLLQPDQFVPGFIEQVTGAKAGETRTVNVTFPADFPAAALAGKPAVYQVEISEVKEKSLPALDAAFAKSYGAESLDALRAGVRTDLQNELHHKKRQSVRNQVVGTLLSQIQCDLPEGPIAAETRNAVYEIVNDSQRRGATKEAMDANKDEIYNAASARARERVKAAFVFRQISEREGLKPTQEELNARIVAQAARYQMAPEKFVKELEKRDGLSEIYDQVQAEKVIEFLAEYAKIEDVAPASPPA